MKNVMVANYNPNGSWAKDTLERYTKAQIDNSLRLGWLPTDIVLLSNFPFSYRNVVARELKLNNFCFTGSKMFAIHNLLQRAEKDEVYWVHDLDLWQDADVSKVQFKDIGISTYSRPKYNGGSVFYRPAAADMVKAIVEEITRQQSKREEPVINVVLHRPEFESRVTVLDSSYNVGCSGYVERLTRGVKPIKGYHFHPTNRIGWDTHVRNRNGLPPGSTISKELCALLYWHFKDVIDTYRYSDDPEQGNNPLGVRTKARVKEKKAKKDKKEKKAKKEQVQVQVLPPPTVEADEPAPAMAVSAPTIPGNVFYHRGSGGDIVYALPTIRALGGGTLVLRDQFYARFRTLPMGLNVMPLSQVEWDNVTHNLDAFRVISRANPTKHLCECIAEPFNVQPDFTKPWLPAIHNEITSDIVINRTGRYRGEKDLDWNLLQPYVDRCLFIGKPDEYEAFIKQYPALRNTRYTHTGDALAAAKVIASGSLFIGNQSMCFALAEAMKHPRVLERCTRLDNCRPYGVNGYTELTQELLDGR